MKKRSGTALPPTHQILLDLKSDLGVLYDQASHYSNLSTVQIKLDFVNERLELLSKIEGEDTESRLKGFLLFRLHNLLIEKVTHLQRKNKVTEKDMKELGPKLANSLQESADILMQDQGCPKPLIHAISTLSKINGNSM